MEREEQFRRNLKHAAVFIATLLDHHEALASLPDGGHIVLMPADDPKLCAANETLLRHLS